ISSMEKHLFNLKFAAKELQRNSKKCDKEEKADKIKAIQKGDVEAARIHAENAIRQKHQSINFLRMSISALMDKFENQYETLDVQTVQMEDTMGSTTTLTTPQLPRNDVDMLLHEMADEAGLDLNLELPSGQTSSLDSSVASTEQDELQSLELPH
uniref:Charged multivesicular body protein 1b-2-like n=1 Tax=Echeneis naucrates TaxID=173247 RepID=A0A665WLG8_ECHNA